MKFINSSNFKSHAFFFIPIILLIPWLILQLELVFPQSEDIFMISAVILIGVLYALPVVLLSKLLYIDTAPVEGEFMITLTHKGWIIFIIFWLSVILLLEYRSYQNWKRTSLGVVKVEASQRRKMVNFVTGLVVVAYVCFRIITGFS